MKKDCFICEKVELAIHDKNPYVVIQSMDTVWTLSDTQFYYGHSFLQYKPHVEHIHQLGVSARTAFLGEMVRIGEIIMTTLHPVRINYEILGNGTPHLHAHIIPRYENDPDPRHPIWEQTYHNDPAFTVSLEGLEQLKERLLA